MLHKTLAGVWLLLWTSAGLTADTHSAVFVTPQWVQQQSNLVLIHVGEEDTYRAGHLPGAHLVNTHADFSDPDSHHDGALILEMPSRLALEKKLKSMGVNRDSLIVVYWSDDDVTNATRAAYTLLWAGLGNQVKVLAGGLDAWTAQGGALTQELPPSASGNVTLEPDTDYLVSSDWVTEHQSNTGIALVDGRSRAHFEGVIKSRGRSGHIPGAGSVPWTELVDHNLQLKSSDQLRRIFADAGVKPGDTVVAYCHIGQFATMVLLAARSLGHDVKLYDGAFQDWAEKDLPVTTQANL